MIDPRGQLLLSRDPYATGLGVRLVEATDSAVTVALTVGERHLNFLGVGHGGLVFSVADVAFSIASNFPGPMAVAVATHLALTSPARLGDELIATAIPVSRGRTMATYRTTVTRQDGAVVGFFTGTVAIREGV